MARKKSSGVSGMLGDDVTVRKVNGKYRISNPNQKRTNPVARERFREAAQYARHQVSLPESNALYAAGITEKKPTALRVAMSDYLSAPKVKSIDTSGYRGKVGDTISVKAVDDFMVTRVNVVIKDASGAVIEEGEAGPDSMLVNQWGYHARKANPGLTGTIIWATAYDRPGNKATAEVTL